MRALFPKLERSVIVTLVVFALFSFESNVEGAQFEIVPTISLSERYTNNLYLAEHTGARDLITLVNPGLMALYRSRTIEFGVDYDYYQQFLYKNPELNTNYQELDVTLAAQPLRILTLTGNANIGYEPISYADQRISDAVISREYERISNGFFSPAIGIQRDAYYGELSYIYGLSRYHDRPVFSSDSSGVRLRGGVGQDKLLSLDVELGRTDVQYINAPNSDAVYQQAEFTLTYHFSPKLSVFYERGYERYTSERVAADRAGYLWSLGVEAKPKDYLTVELNRGERYYGSSYQGLVNYHRRRIEIDVSYQEELTSRALSFYQDINTGSTGIEDVDFRNYLTETNDILLEKNLQSSFRYTLGRALFSYDARGTHRYSQLVHSSEKVYLHRLAWRLRMARNSALSASYEYRRSWRYPIDRRVSDVDLSLRFSRAIRSNIEVSGEASRLSRDSSDGVGRFTELQLMLSLETRF